MWNRTARGATWARLAGIIPVLLFPLLWAAAAVLLHTPLLPGPMTVIHHLVNSGSWVPHLAASLSRIGAGLLLALAAGLPAGILAGGTARLSKAFSLLAGIGYPVPKIVLLPPLVLLLGVGEAPKILLIFLVLFFPLMTAVRDAVRSLPDAWFDSLASLGVRLSPSFPSLETLKRLILPAILPAVLSSIRISLGIAVAVLFFAENFGTRLGIGHFIMDARTRVDYVDLYGGIVILSFSVLLIYLILDWLEYLLTPWRGRDQVTPGRIASPSPETSEKA